LLKKPVSKSNQQSAVISSPAPPASRPTQQNVPRLPDRRPSLEHSTGSSHPVRSASRDQQPPPPPPIRGRPSLDTRPSSDHRSSAGSDDVYEEPDSVLPSSHRDSGNVTGPESQSDNENYETPFATGFTPASKVSGST
jgi:hypothetical protein